MNFAEPARCEELLAELLGLGSRHERALVADKSVAEEFDGAEQMLQRLADAAAADEFPKRLQFRRGERPLKLEVEVHALQLQHMSQQVLNVEPRLLNTMLLEVASGGLDDFEDGFHAGGSI